MHSAEFLEHFTQLSLVHGAWHLSNKHFDVIRIGLVLFHRLNRAIRVIVLYQHAINLILVDCVGVVVVQRGHVFTVNGKKGEICD